MTRWLGPPRYDDPELARIAALLNRLQLFLIAGTILWPASLLVAPQDQSLLPIDLGFAALLVCSWALSRRNHVRAAAWTLVGGLLVAATLAIATQGIGSPYVSSLFLVVALSSILLGARAALGTCLAALAFLAWLHFREERGALEPAGAAVSASYAWFVGTMVLTFFGVILSSAARGYASTRRELVVSQERFRELVEGLPDGVISLRGDGAIESFNPEAERLTGWSAAAVTGRRLLDLGLFGAEEGALGRALERLGRGEQVPLLELQLVRPDGDRRWVELRLRQGRRGGGGLGVTVVARDVEERRRGLEREAALAEQLREAQRLEAVGRLAGGVAHDFNNALTIILGNAHVHLSGASPPPTWREDWQDVLRAAEHSAQLTRQLLAFGRRQVLQVRPVDLGESLRGLERLVRRAVGENVRLELRCAAEPTPVLVDPNQLAQIVLNLAANARDAMPDGGTLTIETRVVELDASYADAHVDVKPGPYVLLAVSDTGRGFDAETRARIFEPFFTTKGQRGTGLGLATVHGIVKQSGGNVVAYGEPGRGATFKVYLPRRDGAPAGEERGKDAVAPDAPRNATLLVVDDDAEVLKVVSRMLEGLGYRVLCAASAEEARRICRGHAGPIHLLLSDVIMPELPGPKLAAELAAMRPGLRVLYGSGYTENAIVHHGVLDAGVHFLSKPFTVEELGAKVEEVLAAASPSQGSGA